MSEEKKTEETLEKRTEELSLDQVHKIIDQRVNTFAKEMTEMFPARDATFMNRVILMDRILTVATSMKFFANNHFADVNLENSKEGNENG